MFNDAVDRTEALSVSELTSFIKNHLETGFPSIDVVGEVSNFRPASSGHWYFSIKDEGAVLQCVLFRGRRNGEMKPPSDGDQIRIRGSISVYPPRGSYQLIASSIQPVGRGEILAILEDRKQRFATEGLFARSLALPVFPRRIAIVTSPTGAAIRDVLHVLRRRRRKILIRIIPVPVQGIHAAQKIAAAIRYADHHDLGDTIILTRGGGSIEDLLPFSEEVVIRAIASTTHPVISAIGHEIDWALSDYAADHRAPTPSSAAEIVSSNDMEILDRLHRISTEIASAYTHRVERLRQRFDQIGQEELRYRFRNLVQPWYQRVDEARRIIDEAMRRRVSDVRHRLQLFRERVASASPLAPLERGFALIREIDTGKVITRADSVAIGATYTAQFTDGTVKIERINDE